MSRRRRMGWAAGLSPALLAAALAAGCGSGVAGRYKAVPSPMGVDMVMSLHRDGSFDFEYTLPDPVAGTRSTERQHGTYKLYQDGHTLEFTATDPATNRPRQDPGYMAFRTFFSGLLVATLSEDRTSFEAGGARFVKE